MISGHDFATFFAGANLAGFVFGRIHHYEPWFSAFNAAAGVFCLVLSFATN